MQIVVIKKYLTIPNFAFHLSHFRISCVTLHCDFTNKGNPVCTEYTPDISNTIITQDGYIYYFVATKRADGAIPIIVDVNGQRRPNKATINKNEPKDQYTVLLYDDIYLTPKPTRAPKEGCTEPSCYECNDPSCFCTDPSCFECTDPTCPTECTDPTCTPDPGCTEPSCYTLPNCTAPSCSAPTEPTQDTTPTESTEEPKCTLQAKPVNCIAGNYAADGCTYNCTKYCRKETKPDDCLEGYYDTDGCTYICTERKKYEPSTFDWDECFEDNCDNGDRNPKKFCFRRREPDYWNPSSVAAFGACNSGTDDIYCGDIDGCYYYRRCGRTDDFFGYCKNR